MVVGERDDEDEILDNLLLILMFLSYVFFWNLVICGFFFNKYVFVKNLFFCIFFGVIELEFLE